MAFTVHVLYKQIELCNLKDYIYLFLIWQRGKETNMD